MFNTDTTAPNWEKSPESNSNTNRETIDNQRAQAWAEAFPNDEQNPWLKQDIIAPQETQDAATAPMNEEIQALDQTQELQAMPQMEDAPLQPLEAEQLPPEAPQFENPDQPPMQQFQPQAPEGTNKLNSTDNIVTNQLQEVWNGGEGGQSLTDTYNDLRGSFTAENIKVSADMVNTEVSDTVKETANKDEHAEANLTQETIAGPDMPQEASLAQTQADLYNLAASAGATALGAQAGAETATASLMQDNESTNADSAQRDLEEAQQTLENIQSDIPTIAGQTEQPNATALDTAESVLHDAQQMVIDAQASLEAAQKEAEARQEFIDEHQEEIKDLQDQGVQMEEINQVIDETGNIDTLQEQQEDDDAEPRMSIFG